MPAPKREEKSKAKSETVQKLIQEKEKEKQKREREQQEKGNLGEKRKIVGHTYAVICTSFPKKLNIQKCIMRLELGYL